MMVSHRAFVLGQPSGLLHVFVAFLDRATNYHAIHVMLAGIVQMYYIIRFSDTRCYDDVMVSAQIVYTRSTDARRAPVIYTYDVYLEMGIIFIKPDNFISHGGRVVI